MKFLVTDIEFDFEDSFGELSYDEQMEIRDQHLGVWEADDDDDMIDEITAASGWCIKNIYYDIQLKWQTFSKEAGWNLVLKQNMNSSRNG